MRTVIFDLDGTLADTSGDLIAAANHCFRDMGLTLAGRHDEAVIDAYYQVLLDAYAEDIDTHTVLYPGAMEAVEALRMAGYGVGICTNKPEALAEMLLTRLGVRDAFASMVGADTLPVRKPDPEPLREAARRAGGDPALCLLVGDSDTDRNTARAAGVPSVLVTFGPSGDDMAALVPEALCHAYSDLPDIVTGLIGRNS
jgi:phosphoglycolate phosphatase